MNNYFARFTTFLLIQGQNDVEGQNWQTLTEEQKKQVYLSYEESKDNKNLINWDNLKKKY